MISKIAVIIVTHNGSRYITKCLTSVFSNKFNGQYDVIVVDNASSDDTVEIIKKNFSGEGMVTLISNAENKGFVGGNNIGIGHALKGGCEAVVLLNQDTEVEYDWLAHLAKAAAGDKVGIVQSMLLLANERALTNNVGNALHYLGFGFVKHYRERVDSWYHRPPFEIGYASGAAMLIKKEVLQTLTLPSPWKGEGKSYFDEKFFMYHEDLDLCWRARLAGYKIMIAPQAIVYHHYQFNRNKKMFYWTERNRWACLLQNYSLATLLKLIPILLFVELAMLGYGLVSGWFLYKLQGYGWVLINLPAIFKTRFKTQSMRKVDDKEIMKHMDSKLIFPDGKNFILDKFISPLLVKYYNAICPNIKK